MSFREIDGSCGWSERAYTVCIVEDFPFLGCIWGRGGLLAWLMGIIWRSGADGEGVMRFLLKHGIVHYQSTSCDVMRELEDASKNYPGA